MGQPVILIVDDEERIRKLLKDYLKMKGFEIVEAADGEEAIEKFFGKTRISLVLLDVMMPKMNGWEVLKTIRESSKVPVIMLTARDEEADELQGFSLGADEYIGKPFSPKVLAARIEAVLRRSGDNPSESIVCDEIVMDKGAHSVTAGGEQIDLSYKEYELLEYFMNNKNIALSRENILNNVWNYDYAGDDRTIDTHVKKLRAKLGESGSHIKTIWGFGYKFE